MGLLYGEGDPIKTTLISARCGKDSDCNPSNALMIDLYNRPAPGGNPLTALANWDKIAIVSE